MIMDFLSTTYNGLGIYVVIVKMIFMCVHVWQTSNIAMVSVYGGRAHHLMRKKKIKIKQNEGMKK